MPTKEKNSPARRRWQKILTPGICACLIVVVICLVGGIVSVVHPRTKRSANIYTVVNLSSLDQVKPGDILEQRFTVDDDYDSFGLYFANYSRPTHQGKLVLTIQPEGASSTTLERSLGSLLDNSFVYFDYHLNAGTTYILQLHTSDTDSPITFFTSTSDQNPASLSVNGKPSEQHLIMAFTKSQKDIFAAWYFIMGAALATFIALAIVNKEFYDSQKSSR